MAEPETFEDDLFADLYTEDDNAPKGESTAIITEVSAPVEPKAEEPVGNHEANSMVVQTYEAEQEMEDDDEIDFNLGNGASYDPSSNHESNGPGIKEDGKMFIGGLNWETTDESLKEYFSQFGEVLECTVMRDGASGRSRGFGFLTFKDARTVNIVMVKEHYLDGKIIDPKRAIPRDEQERTSKIFVGGVSQEATEQDFKEYFMQFGRVVDATLMMDKDTGRPRGFGFVTFDSEAAVEACLDSPLEILGKPIEVKKAQPRGNMREEEEVRGGRSGAGGGRFRKGGADEAQHQNQAPSGPAGQMGAGGMTPQLMAQYWQRMQQYFAMMQSQMAMGRGMPGMPGGMNPAMMQQMMQMQQMQQMQQQMQGGNSGRSQSPQSPNAAMAGMQGMNPQMMQQMQQMQAQAMGGGGNNPAGNGSNPGGRVGTPGYNAYEQQMFEQQKYEQQQMRRAGRDQSQYGGGGGSYGMGGGNGPTSWEGMYDDVPQPAVPSGGGGRGSFQGGRGGGSGGGSNRGSAPPQSGPVSAPPANAPTGPKNAGKPGANYRGGGRGGAQRGFHPYARG
ncbi:hypothetical protein BJ875DRAFT_460650 [Amylocarpus encephaloides]|uniref:RRM domain-containing protein n=1 Tax=Amylocarpus encephaloides TaxID=45428 RepID=A0A9P7YKC5_9HELO|nr:hypothetical protein BJ875DRAFT_460650 [Amylocarpus encephaloides]